jgi:hypothetical protein
MEDEQVSGQWMTSLVVEDLPLRPSWAFVDGALIVSLHAEPVRALLRQAGKDAPPSWLEVQGQRESLGDFDPAFASSAADLQTWLQAEIAAPLDAVARSFGQSAEADRGGDPARAPEESRIAAEMIALAKALPSLIEKHLHGTMRTAVWIESGTLRSRFWSY